MKEITKVEGRYYFRNRNKEMREVVLVDGYINGCSIPEDDYLIDVIAFSDAVLSDLSETNGLLIYCVNKEGKFGLCKKEGHGIIIPCEYDEIIHEGHDVYLLLNGDCYDLGVVTENHFTKLNDSFDEIMPDWNRRSSNSYLLYKGVEVRLCTEENGELFVSDTYEEIERVYDENSHALFSVTRTIDGFTRYGIINAKGLPIVECEYLEWMILEYSNIFVVLQKDNQKLRIFNALDRSVVLDDVDNVSDFYDVKCIVVYKDEMQSIVNYDGVLEYPPMAIPYNYKLDLNTLGYDFVAVRDANDSNFIGILNLKDAIDGRINIYSQDNWDNIYEGFAVDFDGAKKLLVRLRNGGYACYDDSFNELYQLPDGSANDQEVDPFSWEDDNRGGQHEWDDRDDSPLDAFEGDEDLYNEWRLNS